MSKTAFLSFLRRLRRADHFRRVATGITARLLVNKENVEQWKKSDVRSATGLWLNGS